MAVILLAAKCSAYCKCHKPVCMVLGLLIETNENINQSLLVSNFLVINYKARRLKKVITYRSEFVLEIKYQVMMMGNSKGQLDKSSHLLDGKLEIPSWTLLSSCKPGYEEAKHSMITCNSELGLIQYQQTKYRQNGCDTLNC